jgi:hypothetical protein
LDADQSAISTRSNQFPKAYISQTCADFGVFADFSVSMATEQPSTTTIQSSEKDKRAPQVCDICHEPRKGHQCSGDICTKRNCPIKGLLVLISNQTNMFKLVIGEMVLGSQGNRAVYLRAKMRIYQLNQVHKPRLRLYRNNLKTSLKVQTSGA